MSCIRMGWMALAMVVALIVSTGTSMAQEIRYFVAQSTGLFEIRNISTGGRFVVAPTGETLLVDGRGVLLVRGYTDRAQRGETVVTQVRGSGVAFVDVGFTPPGSSRQAIFAENVPLTLVVPRNVSMNTNVDNLTVEVRQGNRFVTRRLPIGSRS